MGVLPHQRWFRPLERRVYGQYDALVAISAGVRDSLERWLRDPSLAARISTIENGSRMLPFTQREMRASCSARLISIGSLSPQTGFDVAIRAIGRIKDRVARYTIVGEGPERAKLEELVRSLGLGNKVLLPGWSDDIELYLQEAHLGIVPSRWEGFGLVAVEALSTGLPLVVSDVPGLRDVVADCDGVVLVPPEDDRALADRICYAIENLVACKQIANKARSRAEMFTIDAMVSRYARLYKRLCFQNSRCEVLR